MILGDTLPATLAARSAATPEQAAFWSRDDDGHWSATNWAEVQRRVGKLAWQLRLLGIGRGDRVALVLPTTPEWEYAQHAVLAAGGVVVGLDASETEANLRHMLQTVQPSALIVETRAIGDRLRALAQGSTPRLVIAEGEPGPDGLRLDELLARPMPATANLPAAAADDLATIIFTSGSTGQPKGIAYTHAQLVLVGRAILEQFPSIDEGARLACWLPLSNLFQRIINLCALICGAQSWFVRHPAQIMERLPEIRPSLFVGVPRFFEKLYAGIVAQLDARPAPVRTLAHAAWRFACEVRAAERAGLPVAGSRAAIAWLADRLVLSRIRAAMGPNLQFMVSGSAPIPVWLLERFHGLGWLVLEAYGTSENALPIALNTPAAYRFGTVGRPLAHNALVIAEDGEILVRGPALFSGYWGTDPADAGIDDAGFLHTGDLGRVDDSGFLALTGRKSELFKTSTGRRIAPGSIEALIKRVPAVEHAVLVGRNRPFPVAIVDLALPPAADAPGSGDRPSRSQALVEALGERILAACRDLPAYQRPAAILVSPIPFSVDGGQLTANQKLRRQHIEALFARELDVLYRDLEEAHDTGHPRFICRRAGPT
ncbi:MAG: AMP-dependent synthetase/ligase [Gammaproteobacteria bacterium]